MVQKMQQEESLFVARPRAQIWLFIRLEKSLLPDKMLVYVT